MGETDTRLLLPDPLWQATQAHALACLPEEACGLLGGVFEADGTARAVQMLPIENALHSPVRFCMDPAAQLQAFQALEAAGLELLAIFHSHPTGPHEPSPTDLAEFAYPGVLSLILFPSDAQAWSARAFHIQGALFSGETPASFTEVPLLFRGNAAAATG